MSSRFLSIPALLLLALVVAGSTAYLAISITEVEP